MNFPELSLALADKEDKRISFDNQEDGYSINIHTFLTPQCNYFQVHWFSQEWGNRWFDLPRPTVPSFAEAYKLGTAKIKNYIASHQERYEFKVGDHQVKLNAFVHEENGLRLHADIHGPQVNIDDLNLNCWANVDIQALKLKSITKDNICDILSSFDLVAKIVPPKPQQLSLF